MGKTTENKVITKGCGLTEEQWPRVDAAARDRGVNRNQFMRWAIEVALEEHYQNQKQVTAPSL